jgi:hypothetical protein
MLQDSSISSTDTPQKVPHLQITKYFHSEEEYIECMKNLESAPQIPYIVHYCDVTSTLKVAQGREDTTSDSLGRVSISKVQNVISNNLDRGYYFVLTDIRPAIVSCRNKVITIRYPLFAWRTKPNASARNMHMDCGFYMKWFIMYKPHAMRHFGRGVCQSLDFLMEEVSAFNSFHGISQDVLRSTLTDSTTQEVIGTYEFSVQYLLPGESDIPILHQIEMSDYKCDKSSCQFPLEELSVSDEWVCCHSV